MSPSLPRLGTATILLPPMTSRFICSFTPFLSLSLNILPPSRPPICLLFTPSCGARKWGPNKQGTKQLRRGKDHSLCGSRWCFLQKKRGFLPISCWHSLLFFPHRLATPAPPPPNTADCSESIKRWLLADESHGAGRCLAKHAHFASRTSTCVLPATWCLQTIKVSYRCTAARHMVSSDRKMHKQIKGKYSRAGAIIPQIKHWQQCATSAVSVSPTASPLRRCTGERQIFTWSGPPGKRAHHLVSQPEK